MRRAKGWVVVAAALGLLLPGWGALATPPQDPATPPDLARFVDPMIGTALAGFVFPGPAMPFGMVQLSPDTNTELAYTGYQWLDTAIRGFSHVHVESMGVHEGGDLPFMPISGAVGTLEPIAYASQFSHATEFAEPGYYRVDLARSGVRAELTAGNRVGVHRYTFPDGAEANVLMHAGVSVAGFHRASLELVDPRTIVGSSFGSQGYAVHFVARFDPPFQGFGGADQARQQVQPARDRVDGYGAGMYVTWDFQGVPAPQVTVKVGISFVSRANAEANLEAELPGGDFDFDAQRARAREAWNQELHRIEVRSDDELAQRSFYTALYHAFHHPNLFTDANGQYAGHDGQVHTADGYTHHANFGMWDTLRGEMQLLALLQPDRFRDMVHTLRAITEQKGRLPRWSLMDTTPDYMPGEPAVPVLADALCRGLAQPEDVAPLYDAMRRAMFERRRDPSYLAYGYVPHDIHGGGASATLEHAMADFAFALVAHARGEPADAAQAVQQAGSWRNLLDPDTRFLRPRDSDGSWMEPFLPELPLGYVEGTGWQYLWLVPHDLRGLFDGVGQGKGGDDLVRERLDTFFATALSAAVPGLVPEVQKTITGFGIGYVGNQYAPSNEHDLQAPYLYDHLGEPWKTQAVVRGLQALYRPTPDGLPGNDDTGTMSAWFVWSALGFHPHIPGAQVYAIGSPLFEEARVKVGDGWFTVRAPGASWGHKYIQDATLGSAPLERTWLAGTDLMAGGTLGFTMGALPSAWGGDPEAAPPSLSTHGLEAFGCSPLP